VAALSTFFPPQPALAFRAVRYWPGTSLESE
jgi:hypothetical protein